ncbi:MAG: 2-C-methyl-D-erythritol 4-phosphate cytidylyltransferase [Nitrospirae bacterium]|nr:2-C-methyl-D-erythritol 4-phosphate cytidylyltransferase [Nitrospirota bacterium]
MREKRPGQGNNLKVSHSQKKVIAIIPAAGLGKRFGPVINKPFQELGGKPLVVWSMQALDETDDIVEIIPVLKEEDVEYGEKIFRDYGISKVRRIAIGGRERQDSVYNGLKFIEDKNCLVLIHDGARPLIEKGLIEKVIKVIKELVITPLPPFIKGVEGGVKRGGGEVRSYDGAILGVPLKDTIKELENGIITKTLKRNSLWAIQTPQVFPYTTIFSAYDKAMRENFYSTDDAALAERYGGKIKVIMGSYRNIKITTPEDMDLAEFLVSKKD